MYAFLRILVVETVKEYSDQLKFCSFSYKLTTITSHLRLNQYTLLAEIVFSPSSPAIWNTFHFSVTSLPASPSFKSVLKTHYFYNWPIAYNVVSRRL